MLSDGTQRHALPGYQSEEMKILNIFFPLVGIEPITSTRLLSHACAMTASAADFFYSFVILYHIESRFGDDIEAKVNCNTRSDKLFSCKM